MAGKLLLCFMTAVPTPQPRGRACALTHTHVHAVNDNSQTEFLSNMSFLYVHVSFFCLVLNSFCAQLWSQLHSVLNNIYCELIKGFGISFFSCLNRKSGSSQLVKCWGRVRCVCFYLHERSHIRLCIFSKSSIGQLTAIGLPHASCCWVLKIQIGAAMESQRKCFIRVNKYS